MGVSIAILTFSLTVTAENNKATVINPSTLERKQVTIGDPHAFDGGFVLETSYGYIPQTAGNLGFTVATRYKTTLSTSMTSVQTTLPVSSLITQDSHTLTMADLGTKVFLTVEPGGNKEEIIMCTGILSSSWTGCTRGLAFYGTSTASVAANQKTHSAGSVVIMSNVHYVYDEAVDKDSAETIEGIKTFTSLPIGPSSIPTANYQFANKYYVDYVGAGGFTSLNASTTRGLSVDGSVPERVGINASTTTGVAFDTTGKLYQKVTTGLLTGSNGIGIDYSTNNTWTGTNTFSTATTTISATTTLSGLTTASNLIISSSTLTKWPNASTSIATKGYTDLKSTVYASTTPFSNNTIINAGSETSFTDVNVSSIVGAKSTLLFLRAYCSTNNTSLILRRNGELNANWEAGSSGGGTANMHNFVTANYDANLIVMTDSAGIFEYRVSGNNCTVLLDTYIN